MMMVNFGNYFELKNEAILYYDDEFDDNNGYMNCRFKVIDCFAKDKVKRRIMWMCWWLLRRCKTFEKYFESKYECKLNIEYGNMFMNCSFEVEEKADQFRNEE